LTISLNALSINTTAYVTVHLSHCRL